MIWVYNHGLKKKKLCFDLQDSTLVSGLNNLMSVACLNNFVLHFCVTLVCLRTQGDLAHALWIHLRESTDKILTALYCGKQNKVRDICIPIEGKTQQRQISPFQIRPHVSSSSWSMWILVVSTHTSVAWVRHPAVRRRFHSTLQIQMRQHCKNYCAALYLDKLPFLL